MARKKTATGINFRPPGGPGWGGPASGSVGDRPAGGGQPLHPRPRVLPPVSESDAEIVAESKATLVQAMRANPLGVNGIAAAEKLLNRILGTPVATNLNVKPDDLEGRSADDLARERARIDATIAEARARRTESSGTGGPDDVVH